TQGRLSKRSYSNDGLVRYVDRRPAQSISNDSGALQLLYLLRCKTQAVEDLRRMLPELWYEERGSTLLFKKLYGHTRCLFPAASSSTMPRFRVLGSATASSSDRIGA